MARVLKGFHIFTCTLRVHPLTEYEPYLPFPSQPKLVLIYRPTFIYCKCHSSVPCLSSPRTLLCFCTWYITYINVGFISSSAPSSLSPLASSLTRSVFHSELKTWLFSKSFPPQSFSFPIGLIPRTLGPSNNDFTLLNGWICLHGVLDWKGGPNPPDKTP